MVFIHSNKPTDFQTTTTTTTTTTGFMPAEHKHKTAKHENMKTSMKA
jgi:hypothetical protein